MTVNYLRLISTPHYLNSTCSIFSRSLSCTQQLIRPLQKHSGHSVMFATGTTCNSSTQTLTTLSQSENKIHLICFRHFVRSSQLTGTNSDQLVHAGSKTVDHVCRVWTSILEKNNVPESKLSVEYIVAHVVGEKTLHKVPGGRELSQQQVECVNALCQQRLQRKPVQYIMGEWDFHHINLKLKPPVFIPRPETEELVELAIQTIENNALHCGRLLELCCGSGAIILSLLHKFPLLCGVAVDISPEACSLTEENAQRLGVSDRLTVLSGDLAQSQVQEKLKALSPFDQLVSNPPYIPRDQMSSLELEVLQYEDHRAVDGGVDGLDVVRCMLRMSSHLMHPERDILLEILPGQAEAIEEMVSSLHPSSLQYITSYQDVNGRERFCRLRTVDNHKSEQWK